MIRQLATPRTLGLVIATVLTLSTMLALTGSAFAQSAVQLAPGVEILPQTGTVFKKLAPMPITVTGGKRILAQVVSLRSGSILATVDESAGLMVHAPHQVNAIVSSGQMAIAYANGETAVANINGQTLIADARRTVQVDSGTIRVWSGGGTREQTAMPPPSEIKIQPLWVDHGDGADVSGVTWSPVPEAAEYDVLVGTGEQQRTIRTMAPALPPGSVSLRPGRYELRIRALDSHGIPGALSVAHTLRVVGLDLPDGAYVDDEGTVRLGEGQRLRFTDAEDIAVSAGRDGRYVTVTDGVSLMGGEGVTVWLRRNHAYRPDASLRVEPRPFGADVRIGPKGTRWPKGKLFISVKVHGAGGAPLPAWVRPEPTVLLGIKPLEVDWKRMGDKMVAVLEGPPQTPGPWVVRVRVDDQFGVPIARDFFEVAANPGL